MSYQASGDLSSVINWLYGGKSPTTGGSGTTGTEADKRPADAPDVIKLWIGMKSEMAKKYGVYPARIDGRTQPRLTYSQVSDLFAFWGRTADTVSEQMLAAGKSISGINAARARLIADQADWTMWVLDTYNQGTSSVNGYLGQYLFMPATDRAMQAISKFVVAFDNGIWAGYNIESIAERIRWALPSWLRPVFDLGMSVARAYDKKNMCEVAVVKDICDASDKTLQILKWLTYGTIGVAAVWGISTLAKKKRRA